MKHFLSDFPIPEKLVKETRDLPVPEYREVNGHIHTPYSFSAFPDLDTAFVMAKKENIKVLGINDFYVTDGYADFHDGCLKNGIFPLFNIEFIGLMKEEQKNGIRINDPNNPGRIYFSGKGLDYPFETGWIQKRQLKNVIKESQNQVKAMIVKLNELIRKDHPSLYMSYDLIKNEFARELVRERHVAKALRMMAVRRFAEPEKQIDFLERLYGKKSKIVATNSAALENEIRSNLLKSGGAAFVEEDENSFLDLDKIIKIIITSGGIPCYPVLLDDPSGKFTEFESDKEKLYSTLKSLKVECIELIPGRNDINILRDFVNFFHEKGFIITFGTEHNTPELIPLTVTARGGVPLDESLKKIGWEGACVIAAHQYLRSEGMQGYVLPNGRHSIDQRTELIKLGQLTIEYYLKKHNETRTN
ncbi:MAG TPA: hypothetical protein VK207_08315 [Bacteroidales bacterium]|nr:hypothetical protein [Bacteroidales bacterium]